MSTERLRLALPIDIPRTQYDTTVTQTQIDNNAFLGSSDDRDTLESLIEDAESEFHARTGMEMRLSRAGTSGSRETYDQVTYETPGHEAFKRQWTQVGGDYLNQEVTTDLGNDRILPFDSSEGDEAWFYRGLSGTASGDGWEDVTDEEGDLWSIVDNRHGTIAFHPLEIDRAMQGTSRGLQASRQRELRFAISYRYGTLGGSRNFAGQTTLSASLSQGATSTVGVDDASRLPTTGGGAVILLVGREYLRATVDASTDEITVLERGVRGTNDTGHDDGDGVVFVPGSVRKAVAARAGMALAQSGRYNDFVADADDSLDRSQIIGEMEDTWEGIVSVLED